MCPCCGKHVFSEGPGSFEICPVCGWEDDAVQYRNPDFRGGANRLSLNEAIRNYAKFEEERFDIDHLADSEAEEPND